MGINGSRILKTDPSLMSTNEMFGNDMREAGACQALCSLLFELGLDSPTEDIRDPDVLLQWVVSQVRESERSAVRLALRGIR